MKYRNLKAEIARNGFTYKDIATAINKLERSVQNKLCNKSEWTRSEMIQVKEKLFSTCTIEYLFFEE